MKIDSERKGDRLRMEIRGDVDTGCCGCLEAFWERRVRDQARCLELVLAEVDEVDAFSLVRLVDLLRAELERGTAVIVRGAPQVVAHNLYRLGLLRHPGLRLVDCRSEEPYG